MKIIDESKLRGYPPNLEDKNRLRVILYNRIKKFSNGEKIFLIKNKHNSFNVKNSTKDNNLDSSFFKIWYSILEQKQKNGEVEYISFNNKDQKIKNIAHVSENITEINSLDPRLILIWNWNPYIRINIWFKNKNVFLGNKYEFDKIIPDFDITNKKDWTIFLSFFLLFNDEKLKGVGWKTLLNKMKNKDKENISNEIKIKIKELLREMA